MKRIKGSAVGARVGGCVSGVPVVLITLLVGWGASNWWVASPLLFGFGFLLIRPWFLGVHIGPGQVTIKSWFRTYHISSVDAAAVGPTAYYGFFGVGLGWIPFVGRVAMLEIQTPDGRFRWFPSTFNTRNRTLRMAQEVRSALGLPPG